MGEVRQDDAGRVIDDDSPQGHPDLHIVRLVARAVLGSAVAAAGSDEFPFIAEIHQRIEIVIDDEPDTAAAAPVPAVGPAVGHEFLSPETGGAVAAAPGFHIDPCFICK